MAMVGAKTEVILTPMPREAIKDWRTIIHHMRKHLISVLQLVSDFSHYLGYANACKLGAEGVWSSGLKHLDLLVWHVKWDEEIKQRLITPDNKTGDITMNNLELAGLVLGWLVLELHTTTLKHHHAGMFCNNTSAVSWTFKMRTSKSIPATRLLRMLGL
eukprot:8820854-Ditylum_brightwellii.AAC.1